jgi:ABC-type multidrug transport system fused ATPase/permease subunit
MAAMQIYDNKLKIENIRKLDSFRNNVEDNGKERIGSVDSIEFDNVSFTYPGAASPALDGVSFSLRKAENLALVGLNGSGKTTLIKLLLRMYDPDSGAVRINGKDIKEYRLDELRSNFSVHFQEMRNYSATLLENLSIADGGNAVDEAAAKTALDAAYCGDIMAKAHKGLATPLTRRFDAGGIELSGGQQQKVALARALYRRHTALVLDEPSSSLDPMAEHEIFKALRSITEGKMTIFTSHRLSNVSLADRVIVLERGRVVEDGTQEQRLKSGQRYAELFRYQQEKYAMHTAHTL